MSFAVSLCEIHNTAECPCKTFTLKVSMCTAAITNDVARVRELLLQKKARAAQRVDDHGYTALHYAAQHGHLAIMALLLEQGRADANAAACGCTPLHRAAYGGKLAACRMLLDNGARLDLPDATTGDRRTPVLKAAWQGHAGVVALLLERGADGAGRDPSTGLTPTQLLAQSQSAPLGAEGPATAAATAAPRGWGGALASAAPWICLPCPLPASSGAAALPPPSSLPSCGNDATAPPRPAATESSSALPTAAVTVTAADASAPVATSQSHTPTAPAVDDFGIKCPLCGKLALSVDRIPCCGAFCCDRCIAAQLMRPRTVAVAPLEHSVGNGLAKRCCPLCAPSCEDGVT